MKQAETTPTAAPSGGLPLHALLAVLLWGISFVAIRVAVAGLHPFTLVWTRLGLGAALLYAILGARGEALLPRRADRGVGVALGLLLGAHLLIQSFAMQLTTAMRAGWLVAIMPVTIALGAQLFRRERMRAIGWLGVVVASSGVFVLTATRPSDFARAGTGDWLLLGSSLTWTAYTLLSIDAVERNGALRIAAFAMAVAVVPNALASGFTGIVTGPLTARILVAQLFLGLFSSGVAFWAWSEALRRFGAQRSSAVLYLQPFVTLAAALLVFDDETLGANVWIGGPTVLFGVWLVRRAK